MRASARTRFVVDLIFFLGFLTLMQPALTGIPLHEWFSLAVVAVMAFHLLFQWDWVIQVTRRFFQKVWHKSRLNYLLDVLLLLSMSTAFVSGFAISREVLPFFGLRVGEDRFWRFLHSLSADVTLLVVAVHVGLHWDWIVSTLRRLVRRPRPRQPILSAQEVRR